MKIDLKVRATRLNRIKAICNYAVPPTERILKHDWERLQRDKPYFGLQNEVAALISAKQSFEAVKAESLIYDKVSFQGKMHILPSFKSFVLEELPPKIVTSMEEGEKARKNRQENAVILNQINVGRLKQFCELFIEACNAVINSEYTDPSGKKLWSILFSEQDWKKFKQEISENLTYLEGYCAQGFNLDKLHDPRMREEKDRASGRASVIHNKLSELSVGAALIGSQAIVSIIKESLDIADSVASEVTEWKKPKDGVAALKKSFAGVVKTFEE